MTPKLNKELIDAVDGHDQIEAINPANGQKYIIIERSVFELTQRQTVHDAIQRGIDDVEAGRTMPLEESKRRIEEDLEQFRE